MTPSMLRLHLKLNRVCNMFDLQTRFNKEPSVIRDMMQIWIRKGKVCCQKQTDKCGSQCSKCHPLMTEMYTWVSSKGAND